MEANKSEVKKLIDSNFIREVQQLDWVATTVLIPKKNKRSRSASIIAILMLPALKVNSLFQSQML